MPLGEIAKTYALSIRVGLDRVNFGTIDRLKLALLVFAVERIGDVAFASTFTGARIPLIRQQIELYSQAICINKK
jgi:hypothetical protein